MQQIETNKSINIDLSHEVINSIISTISTKLKRMLLSVAAAMENVIFF
jgi:hypothetical protein